MASWHAEPELEAAVRRRRAWLSIMLALEALCAVAGVASFLAPAGHELGWSAVFAIAAAIAYLYADEVDRT